MLRTHGQASRGEGEGPSPCRPPQEAVRWKGPAPAPGRHGTHAPSRSGTGGQTPNRGEETGPEQGLPPRLYQEQLPTLEGSPWNLRITWERIGTQAFPSGSVVKNLSANAGATGSIPGLGRSPGEGDGHPLQYSCLKIPWTEGPGRSQSLG